MALSPLLSRDASWDFRDFFIERFSTAGEASSSRPRFFEEPASIDGSEGVGGLGKPLAGSAVSFAYFNFNPKRFQAGTCGWLAAAGSVAMFFGEIETKYAVYS